MDKEEQRIADLIQRKRDRRDEEVLRSSAVRNWTDKQVVQELTSTSLINRVRHELDLAAAKSSRLTSSGQNRCPIDHTKEILEKLDREREIEQRRLGLFSLPVAVKVDVSDILAAIENRYLDIVLDGPPSDMTGQFVEVESPAGTGVKVGEWIDRGDDECVSRFSPPSGKSRRALA